VSEVRRKCVGGPFDGRIVDWTHRSLMAPSSNPLFDYLANGVGFGPDGFPSHIDGAGNPMFVMNQYEWDGEVYRYVPPRDAP
jgi:hypothetical protein